MTYFFNPASSAAPDPSPTTFLLSSGKTIQLPPYTDDAEEVPFEELPLVVRGEGE
jgi:hypothetical protein